MPDIQQMKPDIRLFNRDPAVYSISGRLPDIRTVTGYQAVNRISGR